MGWWAEHVVPRITHTACGREDLQALRRRACASLSGAVVELGFGSGHNVAFYPQQVTRVAAVEPSDVSWRLAGKQLAAARTPVERAGLDGQALPFADASFDSALSTWTLCTIPDAGAALREVKRVLRPGGRFVFLEHGLAPDEDVRRWQRRLDPLQQRLCGGCHLTRQVAERVEAAGLTITAIEASYLPGRPRFESATVLGVAEAGVADAGEAG